MVLLSDSRLFDSKGAVVMGQVYSKPLTRAQKEAMELRKKLREEKEKSNQNSSKKSSKK